MNMSIGTIEKPTPVQDARERPASPRDTMSPRQRDDLYYRLLAGTAHTRMLESLFDLRLPHLLAERGPLTAAEIAEALGLHLTRTAKWLILLERVGLLRQQDGAFQNTEGAIALFWDKEGRENYFLRDQLEFCRFVNVLDFPAVLRGAPLPDAVRWPPQTKEHAAHLELWMTVTQNEAVDALVYGTEWNSTKTLVDVGGGDGGIACELVTKYEHLRATVFNLPASADIARTRIARSKLESRVSVVEGDFRHDALPGGVDRVLFSRVLADWDPAVCQMLLKKARAALNPGGTVVISEPFDDTNRDLAVSWEFRYAFYDDFGAGTYKSIAQYKAMLKNAGFSKFTVTDRINDTLYGVITAQ
jgi:SAM-dependent methyltransferase